MLGAVDTNAPTFRGWTAVATCETNVKGGRLQEGAFSFVLPRRSVSWCVRRVWGMGYGETNGSYHIDSCEDPEFREKTWRCSPAVVLGAG
jgi:hypothetical protein